MSVSKEFSTFFITLCSFVLSISSKLIQFLSTPQLNEYVKTIKHNLFCIMLYRHNTRYSWSVGKEMDEANRKVYISDIKGKLIIYFHVKSNHRFFFRCTSFSINCFNIVWCIRFNNNTIGSCGERVILKLVYLLINIERGNK